MDKDTALHLALNALKELVAQNENRYWAIKHDHFAMQDARFAIARLQEIEWQIRQNALNKKSENARELGLDYYISCCADQTCPKCKAAKSPLVIWMQDSNGNKYEIQDSNKSPLLKALEAKLKEKNT